MLRDVQQIERIESQKIINEILPEIEDKTWETNVAKWQAIFSGKIIPDTATIQDLLKNWERIITIAKQLIFVPILVLPPATKNLPFSSPTLSQAQKIDFEESPIQLPPAPNLDVKENNQKEKVDLPQEKKRALKFCEEAGKFFGIEISSSLLDDHARQAAYAIKLFRLHHRSEEMLNLIKDGTWEKRVELWETIFKDGEVNEVDKNVLFKNWRETREIAHALIRDNFHILAALDSSINSEFLAKERNRAINFCRLACDYFNLSVPLFCNENEQECAYVETLPSDNNEIRKLNLVHFIESGNWEKQITLWRLICSGDKKLDETTFEELHQSWEMLQTTAKTLIFKPFTLASVNGLKEKQQKALQFCEDAGKLLGITISNLDNDENNEFERQKYYAVKLPEQLPEKNNVFEIMPTIKENWSDLKRWELFFEGKVFDSNTLELLEESWSKISHAVNILTSLENQKVLLPQRTKALEFRDKANHFFGFKTNAELPIQNNDFFNMLRLIRDDKWNTSLWESVFSSEEKLDLDKVINEQLISNWENLRKIITTVIPMKLASNIDHATPLHTVRNQAELFCKKMEDYFKITILPSELSANQLQVPDKDKIQKLLGVKLLEARKEKLLSGWYVTSSAKEKAKLLGNLITDINIKQKSMKTIIDEWENSKVSKSKSKEDSKNNASFVIGQHRWSIFSKSKPKTAKVIDEVKSLCKGVPAA